MSTLILSLPSDSLKISKFIIKKNAIRSKTGYLVGVRRKGRKTGLNRGSRGFFKKKNEANRLKR